MDNLFLIVGLGNPGRSYKNNRHNIGFKVIDALSNIYSFSFRKKYKGLISDKVIGNLHYYFLKPLTFMNLSGISVARVTEFYKMVPAQTLVIHDDVDLNFGSIRFKTGGSAGGHNGVGSIIESLKTKDFLRLKLGVGESDKNMSDYVLGDFDKTEEKELDDFIRLASDAMVCFIKEGIKSAMNKYNNKTIMKDEGVKCKH